jgi:tight adherence protein B
MSSALMLFLALVFGAVVLLAQGIMVPTVGDSARTRRRLQQRLKDVQADHEAAQAASLVREKYLRDLSPLARQLEQLPGMDRLAALIEQAGRSVMAHRLVLLAVALGAAGGLVGWGLTRIGVAAALGAVLGFALPFLKIIAERKARLDKFEEQLPDAIDVVTRALRAGHPFAGAMKLVAEDMDEPVAGEFRQTFNDINYGNDVRRAMLGMLSRVPSVTLMAFVTSVLVQRETGGNLAEILDQISKVVRGRFRFQRHLRTLTAEGRMSAWVLVLVPFVLFAVVWLTSPDYVAVLMNTPAGHKLVIAALVLEVIGIAWIRKIIRIEV